MSSVHSTSLNPVSAGGAGGAGDDMAAATEVELLLSFTLISSMGSSASDFKIAHEVVEEEEVDGEEAVALTGAGVNDEDDEDDDDMQGKSDSGGKSE